MPSHPLPIATNSTSKPHTKTGKYLYAIGDGSTPCDDQLKGIDESSVYSITQGKLYAIVSDYAKAKIRPERRHLAAHQNVLKALMEQTTVLPMNFGTISADTQAIRSLLELNQETLQTQVKRVAGKVEMGLRVRWDVPNIFEYIIDKHAELRVARDQLFSSDSPVAHEQKIALGQMFEAFLNEERDKAYQLIEDVIAPACAEISRTDPRTELEMVNLNCLVKKNTRDKFEELVVEAAGLFDNNHTFDLVGPFAPHNFVEAMINLEKA